MKITGLFRSELAVVAMLVASIFLMVVPVPTEILDGLLATNMALAVLLLMVAFYLRSSVQFSTLPTVILIATIFRLSLSVAVTRLVLIQANAGDVVQTFGDFVVGGNVVVGLTIFLIVTVVQFVVITKGAERVSEVAARFSLDALPGKQMAIDADVRAGNLDQAGASLRRSALELESSLYGAMDGAMKFVKGDAIAGLVIIAINLAGGFAVGVLQLGLSAGKAAQTYSVLTVGDGLVAQIPALLISIAAGTVVTRVAGTGADNIGAEIAGQLTFDSRALWAAAVIVAALALVPGLPVFFFLALAGLLAFLAWKTTQRQRSKSEASAGQAGEAALQATSNPITRRARIRVLISPVLAETLDRSDVARRIDEGRARLIDALGVPFPEAAVEQGNDLPGGRFRLEVDGVVLLEANLPARGFLLTDDPKNALLAEVEVTPGEPLPDIATPLWISDDAADRLSSVGVGYVPVGQVLANAVINVLRRQASLFVGIQEVGSMLAAYEQEFGDLVRETLKIAPLPRIADVSRRLLDEGISLRNYRGLLEAIAEHAAREPDNGQLAEAVRGGLRRQICAMNADPFRLIPVFLIDAEAEALIRSCIKPSPAGKVLNLPAATGAGIVERIKAEILKAKTERPVLIVAPDLRRLIRTFLTSHALEIAILSFSDILSDYTLQPIATISSGASSTGQPTPMSSKLSFLSRELRSKSEPPPAIILKPSSS